MLNSAFHRCDANGEIPSWKEQILMKRKLSKCIMLGNRHRELISFSPNAHGEMTMFLCERGLFFCLLPKSVRSRSAVENS